jgi:hypothetical protein
LPLSIDRPANNIVATIAIPPKKFGSSSSNPQCRQLNLRRTQPLSGVISRECFPALLLPLPPVQSPRGQLANSLIQNRTQRHVVVEVRWGCGGVGV